MPLSNLNCFINLSRSFPCAATSAARWLPAKPSWVTVPLSPFLLRRLSCQVISRADDFPVCFSVCLMQKLEEQSVKIRFFVYFNRLILKTLCFGIAYYLTHEHWNNGCDVDHHPFSPASPQTPPQSTYSLFPSLSIPSSSIHPTQAVRSLQVSFHPWQPHLKNDQPLACSHKYPDFCMTSSQCPALDSSTISFRDGTLEFRFPFCGISWRLHFSAPLQVRLSGPP